MNVITRLAELGLELPPEPAPLATYLPAVESAGQVITSGQLPLRAGILIAQGVVGAGVSVETAAECAATCTLNALAAAAGVLGDLNRIERVVKVTGFVASALDFTDQPAVVNGASGLLTAIFGDDGRHARSAVGVAALPLGAPVEVEITFAVRM